jgi:predicted metal-dependent phosphoesterase TrpH
VTRIDLHCHSTASDGTLTPAQLMAAGVAAGLDVMAITDHDTTGGWAEAAEARPEGLTLVRGAELSCRWLGGPGYPISLHMLAYLFEVRTTNEAFASRWLGARYFVPKSDLDVFEAVRAVREAGGVTVFAHPRATVRGRVVPDRLIEELADAGLFGLEADHEDHSPAEQAHVRTLAERLGLVVTGSSDFHGTHKTVQLGAYTTAIEAYEKIAAAATGVPVLGRL